MDLFSVMGNVALRQFMAENHPRMFTCERFEAHPFAHA